MSLRTQIAQVNREIQTISELISVAKPGPNLRGLKSRLGTWKEVLATLESFVGVNAKDFGEMTHFSNRKQFVHDRLIGRTARIEVLGTFNPSKDPEFNGLYLPMPEYKICLISEYKK